MNRFIVKRWMIGKPLKTSELGEQKLNKIKALAILSSDALSSVAYGTEQILLILASIGFLAYWYSIPIAMGVLVLLLALILSYQQIIYAYPKGGGAYVVSKNNLGDHAGLIAGGSLLVDYILTVAVSVCAGTDAITSAFPSLQPYQVLMAILFVLFITLLNLRGVTESASILAYPVYIFVISMAILIGVGIWKVVTVQSLDTIHTPIGTSVPGISIILLLKAFSSGCSALTGIEAISNAVPNFKEPSAKNAVKTLTLMGVILAILFFGITFLAYWFGISPNSEETVISQVASVVFGKNIIYYFIQGITALLLVLAANTGYAAFPLLAVNLAKDKYMPRIFSVRGDRLGYSNGILTLGLASILLILLFQGHTELLIPLYAVGVFIPFTLSQAGMSLKWLKEKPNGWVGKFTINFIGTSITFSVLLILFSTKFMKVWPVFIFLPLIVLLFSRIKKHYDNVAEQLRVNCDVNNHPIKGNIVILPVSGITRVVENSLEYANVVGTTIIAVYVAFDKESQKQMEEKWGKFRPNIRLVTLYSPYRSLISPLRRFIKIMKEKGEEQNYGVTVIIPQFMMKKSWHNILHNQSSILLKAHLLYRSNIIVTTVPYRFKK